MVFDQVSDAAVCAKIRFATFVRCRFRPALRTDVKSYNMEKKSILLIEDDELDIISFKRILSKFNFAYELYTAFNGIEALELLKQDNSLKPDVIVLDLSMPIMNGFEFLEELQKNSSLSDLNIFIMTTSSETTDRVKAEKYQVKGYFIKPLSYTENTRKSDSMEAFVQFHLRSILTQE